MEYLNALDVYSLVGLGLGFAVLLLAYLAYTSLRRF